MRHKRNDTKKGNMYTDFGTRLRVTEPNILFAAARSLILKSAGTCLPSECTNLALPLEIKRIVNRYSSKNVKMSIFDNAKVKEILQIFVTNKFSLYMEVIGGSHLAIFFPLPFFRVEPINQVLMDFMEGTKF